MKLLLVGAIVIYAVIAAIVWLLQERLMFLPPPATPTPAGPNGWQAQELRLAMRDGTRLAGVLLLPPVERPALVIYFGGNAEDAVSNAPQAEHEYGERALLLVNYRGYGASGGRPGEKAIVADALEIHDWAVRDPRIDSSRIALHGRSVGSGVAVQLAAQRPVRCVVLTTPFDSALAIAKAAYPWLPVALLMRHPFDSAAHANAIRVPALFLVGEADTIIPPAHARRLKARWGGPVEEVSFAGFGHNDISLHPGYASALRGFLDRNLD